MIATIRVARRATMIAVITAKIIDKCTFLLKWGIAVVMVDLMIAEVIAEMLADW